MARQKTWPGFASVVNDSQFTHDHLIRWWGISEDIMMDWYANGAPVHVHIALRTINDLGVTDQAFSGWCIHNGFLIAPNNRKISIRRLERIAELQKEHSIRLVKNG